MDVSMGATVSVKHLNDFSTFGQTLLLFIRTEFSIGNFHRVLCVQCVPYMCSCHGSHLLSAFCLCFVGSLLSQQVMVPISSSGSTASSIDDFSEHNNKHANGIVDSYLVDLDLARIAFSCQFVLDLLCYKEGVLVSTR